MRDCEGGGAYDVRSELVCRPNAGLEGEDENDDRGAGPFLLIEVDGGTANGEKPKDDAVDRIAAAPRNLILLCCCVCNKIGYQLFILLPGHTPALGPLIASYNTIADS